MYVCTAGHGVSNFGQYDEYAFPPNYPAFLYGEPPMDKVSWGQKELSCCTLWWHWRGISVEFWKYWGIGWFGLLGLNASASARVMSRCEIMMVKCQFRWWRKPDFKSGGNLFHLNFGVTMETVCYRYQRLRRTWWTLSQTKPWPWTSWWWRVSLVTKLPTVLASGSFNTSTNQQLSRQRKSE